MHPESESRVPNRRILLLGTQMTVGGAQHSLLSLADGLHARGWQATAAFLYDKDGLQNEWQAAHPFPVLNLDAWRPGAGLRGALRFPARLLRIYRLLRGGRFGVVMTYTQHCSLIGIPLAWLAGVPVRLAANRGRIQDIPLWMERLHGRLINSRLAARLTVNSTQVRAEALALEGVHAEKIVHIPNGVAVPPPGTEAARRELRAELGISPKAPVIISVGRLSAQKGHVILVEALAAIKSQYPRVLLLLAGDGEERPALERQAAALGLGDAVRFLGTRRDAAELMAAADVFVLPSFSEGMPNALLEAAARGLPAVCSDLDAVRGLLIDDETGLLFPPGDAAALAAALADLLGAQERRDRLGRAARNHVQSHYSIEKMLDTYERFFLAEIEAAGR